jgi:hypothetical protein
MLDSPYDAESSGSIAYLVTALLYLGRTYFALELVVAHVLNVIARHSDI